MGAPPMGSSANGQDAHSLTGGTPVPRRRDSPGLTFCPIPKRGACDYGFATERAVRAAWNFRFVPGLSLAWFVESTSIQITPLNA